MNDYAYNHIHSQRWSKTGKSSGSRMYVTPIQKNVYVVTGAPGSGKSYLVDQSITKFDIVFDYDRIAAAMNTIAGTHGDHTYMKSVLLAMRETVIECFARREGDWHNAYFITASPDRVKIDQLLRRMNATELHVDKTQDECIEQIKNDNTRPLKAKDIDLVRDYFFMQKKDCR